MYPENKLLSIVLGIITFIMIIAIIFMNYVINNNKKAITFFNVEDFSNIPYSNKDECKFEIKKNITLFKYYKNSFLYEIICY